MANLAAARLFGEEASENLIGKTLDVLSPKQQPDHTPSPEMAKTRLHSTLESEHNTFEWQFQKNDKSTFHAMVSLSTINIDQEQHILAVVNDISDRKRQLASLQQTLDAAHAANQMNSKVVDEINTAVQTSLDPLIKSSGIIEKAGNLTVEQKLDMAVINRNCRSLIEIMNYRTELSHLADGTDQIETETCNLHELIMAIDQQFSPRADTKKLFFAVSFAQHQSANNVPKLVEADPGKVHKILSILLCYALAHTNKGRIGLHAARKASTDGNITVAFELAYTGTGTQDESLSRVFGTDGDSNPNETDMKYGLPLVSHYARLLGGNIKLDYRQGGITALTIDFPFKKVTSEISVPDQEMEKAVGAA
jgi:PAS domain S-box-containing protein